MYKRSFSVFLKFGIQYERALFFFSVHLGDRRKGLTFLSPCTLSILYARVFTSEFSSHSNFFGYVFASGPKSKVFKLSLGTGEEKVGVGTYTYSIPARI